MKISYNWLKSYININIEPQKLAKILTSIGLEVEGMEVVEQIPGGLSGVFTGEVLHCAAHPNADKLSVTAVTIGGEEPLCIVCGAPNLSTGQKVLVATVGSVLTLSSGETVTIKRSKIRGVESCGMICAEDELGLGRSHEGVMVLPLDTPVGLSAKEYLRLDEDVVFEIGLTPNRIDAASHIGVARDLAAFGIAQGWLYQYRRPSVETSFPDSCKGITVEVEAPSGTPRYMGLTLEGITVSPSPEWLQRRLRAIGLRPINNVVDVTNFVLHETGHPLHAFDSAKIKGNVIKVRYARQSEKIITLDGVERTLLPHDLMICDSDSPLCLAGIFGGANSEVTEQTTSLFLESACFDPVSIRKSSKYHGIKTDASFRFERGVDPDMAPYALQRAVQLLQEITCAKAVSLPVDYYPNPKPPVQIILEWDSLYELLGARIGKHIVKSILKGLECSITMECDSSITVKVPLYRVDVTRPCDLAEEVLRLWGYNNVEVPERISASFSSAVKPDPEEIRAKMENMWVNNGFHEIMCNSLSPAQWYNNSSTFPSNKLVKLLNPLSSDLNVMRQTLIFGGLEVIAYNLNRQQNNLRLFETGNVYEYDAEQEADCLKAYKEYARVAVWMTGQADEQQWRLPQRPAHFFCLKGYIKKLFSQFGLSPTECAMSDGDLFSNGIDYTIHGKVLAYLGEVSKKELFLFGIKQEVIVAEICWDVLIKELKEKKLSYSELPKYPEVRRDLALVLDEGVSYFQLQQTAIRTERRILKRVSLFDLYRGEKLPVGKKQYALSFILQDNEKTLTDKDVDLVMLRLINAFEKETGATLRI